MRIYAVADIHSSQQKINRINTNIARLNPDLLVIAGDVTRYFNPRPTLESIGKLPIPTIIIRGNTDARRIERMMNDYPNIISLHLTSKEIDGFSIVGLSGTIPIPFRSQISLLKKWSHAIDPLLGTNTILVAHPPPWGTLDAVCFGLHAGCPEIRRVILRNNPLLYICGHIHECPGTQQLGNTMVVNCSIGKQGGGALIELEQNQVKQIRMV